MNTFYVDGAYEARGMLGAYCIVACIGSDAPTWKVERVEAHQAIQAEFVGLQAAIRQASESLPATIYSDNVNAIKRLSDWAKRLGVELKHIPGHLAGRTDVEMTDAVKRHHWADVQARGYIQKLAADYNDSGNRIRGFDRINKSVV